jgi:hypothetical protein
LADSVKTELLVPFDTTTPPLDKRLRNSSIFLDMRKLLSFSLAFLSSRFSSTSFFPFFLEIPCREEALVPDDSIYA